MIGLATRASGAFFVVAVLVVLPRPSTGFLVPGTSHAAEPEPDAIRKLLDEGNYAEAERFSVERYEAVTQEAGTDSLSAARAADYLVEALVKNGKGAASSTLALAERVVAIKEQRVGRDQPEQATSLENLGALHSERGEFSAAIPLYERALSIRTRASEHNDSALAANLDASALPLIFLERFAEAEAKLQRSQRLREGIGGQSTLAWARTLTLEALLYRYRGNYASAEPLLEHARGIQRRVSPNHPDSAFTLQVQGDVLFLRGDTPGAQRVWTDGLAIAERAFGPQHPAIAVLLHRLYSAVKASGRVAEARLLIERARKIGQESLAPCHREIPTLLSDSAGTATYEGDYAEAQKLYAESLRTVMRCLGPNHSLTATVIHNEGTLAMEMGDLAASERLHQRAVRIWSNALGANHPYVARGLDALAEVVAKRAEPRRALVLYERALAIRERSLGPNHPDVAWTLTNIAQLAAVSGDLRGASRRVGQALDIYQRGGLPQEPDHLARALQLRGRIETLRGDYATARATYAQALTTREDLFGPAHPLAAESTADVASANFELGAYDEALRSALDAEETGRDHLQFTIRYLPERQAMAYAATRPRGLDLALSITAAGKAATPASVLDAVIRSRGVILDELAARAQAAAADPQVVSANSAFVAAQQRYANLMLRSLQGEDSVPPQVLETARQQKEDAERSMAEQSATARAELARARVGLEDLRRALPVGSALVSFVRYDRTSVGTRQARRVATKVPAYVAIVSRADNAEIRVLPLGTASSIERLVEVWRAEAGGRSIATAASAREAERMYRAAASALRVRIWDPLAESLQGASRVFIVPDGSLNLVSFAALPSGSRYLLENGPTIHYLSTERDLISGDTPTGQGLLAVGGPAFDLRVSATTAATRRSGCGAVGSLHFEDLPGSRAEVQDIARIWGNPSDVLVLTGRAATKIAISRALVGRKVVHLATHGFFLGSGCESAPGLTRGVGSVVGAASSMRTDNPLLLAGLALAGVNQLTRANQANGILNAEEIAGLNLQGTEWAVLSACDTGLGQIRAGEGVFGLRRALQIAGVHTIIMSLWSVEDQSTRDWMKALYAARFEKGLDTPAAAHSAGVRIIEDRRNRGQSTHPFYWGAFVAAGDWR
jgi:CHAT domain-containing protein